MDQTGSPFSIFVVTAGVLIAGFLGVQLLGVAGNLQGMTTEKGTSAFDVIAPQLASLEVLEARQVISVKASMFSIGRADDNTTDRKDLEERWKRLAEEEAAKECQTVNLILKANCEVLETRWSAGQWLEGNKEPLQHTQFSFELQYSNAQLTNVPDDQEQMFEYIAAPLPTNLGPSSNYTDQLKETRTRRAEYYKYLRKACDAQRNKHGSCFLQGISIHQNPRQQNHFVFDHQLLSNFAILKK